MLSVKITHLKIMHIFTLLVFLSIAAGLLLLLFPQSGISWKRKAVVSFMALGVVAVLLNALWLHGKGVDALLDFFFLSGIPSDFLFVKTSGFSGWALSFVMFVFLLVIGLVNLQTGTIAGGSFWGWLLISAGLCMGMLMKDHLYVLVFLWGISGIPLYMLLNTHEEAGAAAAKMTLIVFGSAHGIMITGAVMAVFLNGSGLLSSMNVDTGSWAGSVAFFALLAGGLMKAGIFPFHSWKSAYLRATSGSPSAWLVVLTEKTVGIYFIIRMTQDLFFLNDGVRWVLMVVAAVTVFLSLLLSLSERNTPARIGHLAGMISGMMLLGAATGNAMGATATLAYLMVSVSAVIALLILHSKDQNSESGQPGTKVLPTRGAMVKRLSSILLYSLAGIPPLGVFVANFFLINAFLSGWNSWGAVSGLQLVGAGIAITGSAALVAGLLMFRKTLPGPSKADELGNSRWNFGGMIIALVSAFTLMAAFGGWLALVMMDQNFAIRLFRDAAIHGQQIQILIPAMLLAGSLLLGLLFVRFLEARAKGFLQAIRSMQEKGWLDVYHVFSQMVFAVNRPLSRLHDGVLQTYLVWVLAALALLFLLK